MAFRLCTAWGLPVCVLLLAWALQLHGLERKSLWFDEMGTLYDTGWGGSWPEAIRTSLTLETPKPPLYFVVTRAFLALGDRVFLLRLPAVVLAILTVALTYALGRSLFDRQIGLLGALLLAIAPLSIRYAQEARMYTMWAFFSALSLYLFWRAVHSEQGRWWAGFVIVTVLALYTHLFALLPLGVMILFAAWVLVRKRTRTKFPFRGRHFAAALVVLVLVYAPMVPFLFEGLASSEGLGGEARHGWDLADASVALQHFSGGNVPGLVVYGLAFGVALVVLALRRREILMLTLGWLVLPVIAVFFLPFAHDVRVRYFLFALPVHLLLVAQGLCLLVRWFGSWAGHRLGAARRGFPVGAVAAVALLGVLAGISAPSLTGLYAETKQDFRTAAWLVHTQAKPGDLVLVQNPYQQKAFLFYTGQWPAGANRWTEDNVVVLPGDPAEAFPPGDDHGRWLVVQLAREFLPGGTLEAQIRANHRLLSPTILRPSKVPKNSRVLSPQSFRALAVVPVVPFQPPSIVFRADVDALDRGECTWLRWDVERVREVYLDGQGVVGHGEWQVCPLTTTRYELNVKDMDGTVTLHAIEIQVRAP